MSEQFTSLSMEQFFNRNFMRKRTKHERFWEACSYGREEIVREILKTGVNVDWRSHIHNSCPIHVAAQSKPIILELLLTAGCNIDSRDSDGNTALHHASMSSRVENVKLLLTAGANVNAYNEQRWTPLLNATYWNHPKVIAALLDGGANPSWKNKNGRNALHELCRTKSRDVADMVEGLDLLLNDLPNRADNLTSSQHSAISMPNGAAEPSSYAYGINGRADCPNYWDSEADFTPLLFACYHGHLPLVELLLARGADLGITDQNGWTVLHWAAQRCHSDIVEVLLDHGASLTAQDVRGEMPYHVTNDIGLRECLLPDVEYPVIESNGHVTTDEEDNCSVVSDDSLTPDHAKDSQGCGILQRRSTSPLQTCPEDGEMEFQYQFGVNETQLFDKVSIAVPENVLLEFPIECGVASAQAS